MKEKEFLDRAALLKEKKIFCTECGTYLENFCFSSDADDVEAIKKSLAQCKKSGKIAGEFCAKLFIGEPEDLGPMWEKGDEEEPS